jgi:HEAT repeat protein
METFIPLLKDEHWGVRGKAVDALNKIGDKRAIEHLLPLMKDENINVQKRVGEALTKLGWQASGQEEKIKHLISSQKWKELIKIGEPAVEPLIAAMDNKDYNLKIIMSVLGSIKDPRAIEPIINKVKELLEQYESTQPRSLNKWAKIRAYSGAEGLKKIGKPAVEPLIAVLNDENNLLSVREFAVMTLGKINDPRAVEPLIAALDSIEDSDNKYSLEYSIKLNIVKRLGELGDKRAIEPLVPLLDHEKKEFSQAAAISLKKLKWDPSNDEVKVNQLLAGRDWNGLVKLGAPAVETLIDIVRKQSPLEENVRVKAIDALGKIGDKRAIEPLIPLLNGSIKIRRSAAGSLVKLKWEPSSDEEKIKLLLANQDWDGLVMLGTPAVETLIDVVKYEKMGNYNDLHIKVVETLGRIGDKRAIDTLFYSLKEKRNRSIINKTAKVLKILGWEPSDKEKADYFIATHNWDEFIEYDKKLAIKAIMRKIYFRSFYDYSEKKAVLGKLEKLGIEVIDPPFRQVEPLRFIAKDNKLQVLLDKESKELKASMDKEKKRLNKIRKREAKKRKPSPTVKKKKPSEGSKEHIHFLLAAQKWEEIEKTGKKAVRPLIALMMDKEEKEYIRWGAALGLSKISDVSKPAVEPLIKMVKDRSNPEYSREIAIGALVKIDAQSAFEPLIIIMKDTKDHAHVRTSAAGSLGRMGDKRAVGTLAETLKDKNWQVRQYSAKALGKLKDTRAVDPLISTLKDENWQVRREAVVALGKIGDLKAVGPLIGILNDSSHSVREKAVAALEIFRWEPSDQKTRITYLIAMEDWDELVEIGEPAVEPLIATIKTGDYNAKMLFSSLYDIGDPRAVLPICEELKDKHVRSDAAWILGEFKDPRAVEPLIAALVDENEYVRSNVSTAISRTGEPAVKPLIAALNNKNNHWRIRKEVASIVGWLGKNRAVGPLITAMKDENRHVRSEAAKALGKISDPKAVEPLIAALKDDYPSVRAGASEALGRTKDPRAVEPMIFALKDEKKDVRIAASEALAEMKDPRAVEPLIAVLKDEYKDVLKAAVNALGRIGDKRAVEALIAILEDEKRSIGWEAVNALGKIGDNRAIGPLEKLAEKEDKNDELYGIIQYNIKRIKENNNVK